MDLHKVKEISILKAAYNMNMNPEHVYYTRTSTSQKSTTNLRWTIQAPYQNMGLLPFAKHELLLQLYKQHLRPVTVANGGIATNVGPANWSLAQGIDKISLKEGFALANAVDSASLIINGDSTNFNDVRTWAHALAMIYAGKKITKCTSSGRFWSLDGQYNIYEDFANTGHISLPKNVPKNDTNLFLNEQDFIANITSSGGAIAAAANNADGFVAATHLANYLLQEPLLIAPFNPFFPIVNDESFRKDCPFSGMTQTLPFIDRIDYNLNMSNLSQSLMFNRVGVNTNGNAFSVTDVYVNEITTANLLLYWYKYPSKMSIPMELNIKSWYVRNYETSVNGGAISNDNSAIAITPTNLFELYAVPNLLLFFARRDQSEFYYKNYSTVGRSTNLNSRTADPSQNSMDVYAEIYNMSVDIGDKTGVINTNLTCEELYNLTLKNINYEDFPYSYHEWRGKRTFSGNTYAAGGAGSASDVLKNYPSRCVVALKPYDLGIQLNPGVVTPLTIKVSNGLLKMKSGLPSQFEANYAYNFHIVALYDNYGIEIKNNIYRTYEKNFNNMAPKEGKGVGDNIRRGAGLDRIKKSGGGAYISRI